MINDLKELFTVAELQLSSRLETSRHITIGLAQAEKSLTQIIYVNKSSASTKGYASIGNKRISYCI